MKRQQDILHDEEALLEMHKRLKEYLESNRVSSLYLLFNPDTFLELVRGRPVTLLNLMRVNTDLAAMLRKVPDLWWLLISGLMEAEMPGIPDFAFYVWVFHAVDQQHALIREMTGPSRPRGIRYRRIDDYGVLSVDRFLQNVMYDEQTHSLIHTNRLQRVDYTGFVAFGGNGADIVRSSGGETTASSFLEIVRYQEVNRHFRHVDRLSEEKRRQFCHLYGLWAPFSLGPLHICDTRRLYTHTLLATLVREIVAHYNAVESDDEAARLIAQMHDFLERMDEQLNLLHFTDEEVYVENFQRRIREYAVRYNGDPVRRPPEQIFTAPTFNSILEDYLDLMKEAPFSILRFVAEVWPSFPATLYPESARLIAQGEPAEYTFLNPSHYEQQLRLFYSDPALQKAQLVNELHRLAQAKGKDYVHLKFSACATCGTETGFLDLSVDGGQYFCGGENTSCQRAYYEARQYFK